MSKTRLVIAINSFPYSKGEREFILPEWPCLMEQYDITVISHTSEQEYQSREFALDLGDQVKVIRFRTEWVTILERIGYGIRYLLDRDGWREIFEILKGRKHIPIRLYQSLKFYILGMQDRKRLFRLVLPKAGTEKILYYSFRYDYFCYSMLRRPAEFKHIKVVARTQGYDLYDDRRKGNRQPFQKIMDERIDRLVFVSQFGFDYYMNKHRILNVKNGENSRKYWICKLGVQREGKGEPMKEEPFLLVSCSHAVALKRINLIIDGLSQIEDIKIHWIHFGDGQLLEQLKKYASQKLPTHMTYEFKGYMKNEQIHRFYRENYVDCFITVSSSEGGCPVSIQEAMAYGIPVIGTAVGGITEMIHGNGILLSADPQTGEIAAAIKQIASLSEGETAVLRSQSEELWNSNYNGEINSRQILYVLKGLEREE